MNASTLISRHFSAAGRRRLVQRSAFRSLCLVSKAGSNGVIDGNCCHRYRYRSTTSTVGSTRIGGGHQLLTRHWFSSSTSANTSDNITINKTNTKPPKKQNNKNHDDGVILYERNPESNLAPRAVLGLTTFSSFYWTWYAIDFIPLVNGAQLESLHIQPWWGVAACTLAYAVNVGAAAYCKTMVSKVVLQRDSTNPVHVYRHSLPLFRASTKPMEYGYGQATLDFYTTDVQKLMETITNLKPGQEEPLSGHLALKVKDRRWPLALYLTGTDNIKDKDSFMDTLLFSAVTDDEDDDGIGSSSGGGAGAESSSAADITKAGASIQKPKKTTHKNRTLKSKGRQRK